MGSAKSYFPCPVRVSQASGVLQLTCLPNGWLRKTAQDGLLVESRLNLRRPGLLFLPPPIAYPEVTLHYRIQAATEYPPSDRSHTRAWNFSGVIESDCGAISGIQAHGNTKTQARLSVPSWPND